jgi:hypothetical protein
MASTWAELRRELDPVMVEPGDWLFDLDDEYWRVINVGGDTRAEAWWLAFRFVGDRDAPFDAEDTGCWAAGDFEGPTLSSVVNAIQQFTRGNRVTFRQRFSGVT